MERIPRYDRPEDDPSSLKSGLSEFSNGILHQLWLKSEFKEKIVIGKHDLECSSAIWDSRYGSGNNFDGIHLRGPSGQNSYTRSVMNILLKAKLLVSEFLIPSKESFTTPSSGSQYEERRNNHSNCEQTVYQRSGHSKPSSTSSKIGLKETRSSHLPVFLNRGNINDFYYTRNIFDAFNSHNISGN